MVAKKKPSKRSRGRVAERQRERGRERREKQGVEKERQSGEWGKAAIHTNIDFDWEAINGSSSVDVSVGSSQGPRCRFVRSRAALSLTLSLSCSVAPFVWLVLLVFLLLFFAFFGGHRIEGGSGMRRQKVDKFCAQPALRSSSSKQRGRG